MFLQLPENHAPFRQQTKGDRIENERVSGDHHSVLETAAVYWEPVIKIYGASVKKDLVMTTAHVAREQACPTGNTSCRSPGW